MKMIECTFADGTHYSFAPDDYPSWGPANQTACSVAATPLGGRQETLYQLTGDQWLLVIDTLGSVPTIRVVAPKKVAPKKAAPTARRARPSVTNETTDGKWRTDEEALIWLLTSEGGRPPSALPVALAELPNTLCALANSKHLSPAAAEVVEHAKAVASRRRAETKTEKSKKIRAVLPRDDAPKKLALKIASEPIGSTRSIREIAREFTGGNETDADSLLRTIRNYSELKALIKQRRGK